MKKYVCVKDYVTSEGDVAFKQGKIYELTSNGMLYSELIGVKYYLTEQFKKVNFKKYKPVKSFGGKGLFDSTTCVPTANGLWTGRMIDSAVVNRMNWTVNDTSKEVMRIDANGNIVDTVVESVVKKFQDRSRVGIEKYGTTLAGNNSLTTLQWIDEAQAEAMDFCLYLERLKQEFNEERRNK
jgi:hypothetical protein